MQQKYYKQKQLANVYHVNNLMRGENTQCHLAKEQHIKRHYCVCAQLHCNICMETGVKLDNEQGHVHIPKLAETSPEGNVMILCNQQVLSNRTIPNNKLDIIIHDDEKGTRMLIDAANSGDKNVIKKEGKEILKYKDLIIEIQRMWNVKTNDTSNKRSNWNHFKIIQKIPEQHTGKTRNQGTTPPPPKKKHCTHTSESIIVKVQNM